jgi:microsomal prostaglandin-E synthase 2
MNKKEIEFSEYKKVPIYIDEQGKQVNDSTAIMHYIERFHPKPRVFEVDESKIEIERKWLEWADSEFVRGIPPLIYIDFKSAYKAFGYLMKVSSFNFFEKLYMRVGGAFAMRIKGKKMAEKYNIENPGKHFKMLLETWGKAIHNEGFLGGTRPNGADLAVFCITKTIAELDAFSYVKKNNAFYSWFKRMSQLIQA